MDKNIDIFHIAKPLFLDFSVWFLLPTGEHFEQCGVEMFLVFVLSVHLITHLPKVVAEVSGQIPFFAFFFLKYNHQS